MIEIKRKVSNVLITELGLYHVGQIPTSYTGPHLTVEVVHTVLFADDNGNLQVFSCNPPKAKNSDGSYAPFPEESVFYIEADVYEQDTPGRLRLPAALKTEVDARIALIEKELGSDGKPVRKVI